MIQRIVDWALGQRLLVIVGTLGVLGGGFAAMRRLPVDAFPDVSPVLVQVTTESPGLAPQEVEALVTNPVEVAMNGLPGVTRVQSISAFGLSQVSVYFRDDVDIYFARQLVFERVQTARSTIPAGLGEPSLGPITTGLGQVYQYLVTGCRTGSSSTACARWRGLPTCCRLAATSSSSRFVSTRAS
jgi:cobalt-zinc-cadmium resistance protein CzcA